MSSGRPRVWTQSLSSGSSRTLCHVCSLVNGTYQTKIWKDRTIKTNEITSKINLISNVILRRLIQIGKLNAISIAYLQQSFALAMETCSVEQPVLTTGSWGSRTTTKKSSTMNSKAKANFYAWNFCRSKPAVCRRYFEISVVRSQRFVSLWGDIFIFLVGVALQALLSDVRSSHHLKGFFFPVKRGKLEEILTSKENKFKPQETSTSAIEHRLPQWQANAFLPNPPFTTSWRSFSNFNKIICMKCSTSTQVITSSPLSRSQSVITLMAGKSFWLAMAFSKLDSTQSRSISALEATEDSSEIINDNNNYNNKENQCNLQHSLS